MRPRALAALATGSPPRFEQDERYASWAAKRTPEDGRIDWRQNAIDIDPLIRAAGQAYPGAWRSKGEKEHVVWAARPWAAGGRHLAQHGQIIMRDQSGLAVACGGGKAQRGRGTSR